MSTGHDAAARLFREGDAKGMEEVFSRLRPLVHAVALLEVGHSDDAEDITQEVFRRAIASAHCLDDPSKIKPWLLAITRNFIADQRKLVRNQTGPLDSDQELTSADSTAHPETAAILRERGDRIRRVIDTLPEPFRLPVALRVLEERSYREIAEILDIPPTTLKNLIARGGRLLVERVRAERELLGESES